MIYVDTSVALAHLFAEDRCPPAGLWNETLIASRLIQYEVWTRVHQRNLAASHGDAATAMLGRIALLELTPPVLSRALAAFPVPLRTLDALHVASIEHLRRQAQDVELATYDRRMTDAARALGIPLFDLPA